VAGRFTCWIIVTGESPTAFRAKERDDLLPTLKQLQRTQPDAVLKWFERGQLWDSQLAAQEALRRRRETKPKRDREWRPGGKHADPRARYRLTRDQKRAKFKRRSRQKP
jgi:hypothetical protein